MGMRLLKTINNMHLNSSHIITVFEEHPHNSHKKIWPLAMEPLLYINLCRLMVLKNLNAASLIPNAALYAVGSCESSISCWRVM